ncbi:adenine phosphoribosyltransferase [Nocardioidaceae bacterium]|nr:adenine phosphoribosyltransferase [Nocardioidaceae bacterium]
MEAALDLIRDVPDFPEPGIVFKDIAPLLAHPAALAAVVRGLAAAGRDEQGLTAVTHVVGVESRGFLFGVPVAQALDVAFVPVRKPGKLPGEVHRVSYALEYGEEVLEVQTDALTAGDRVLVVDDVLATGGTLAASVDLVARCGAEVAGTVVLLELGFLDGRAALGDVGLTTLRRV